MKTKMILGLSLAALTSFSHAAGLNVMFDGFCDGVSVSVVNGIAFGTETGCVNGAAVGTTGKVKVQGKAYTLSLNHVPNHIYVLQTDTSVWTIYAPDGSVLQSGTFSNALAARAPGGKATGQ
ncbi:hypothetical protein [Ideonella alba]|uniref:Uncharacterized protein n=1 Tax=Ideonella alba TaxID=2824118 RepID=A0A940Y9V2_9BURK|nr:hypothetical protein [Ideonella alba]MBQ0932617.1 hypothetical protein [Ideonella alba]